MQVGLGRRRVLSAEGRDDVGKWNLESREARHNGEVKLKLYKGNVYNAGRRSPDSLFDAPLSTFEDDRGAYNQKDAEGFIRLNALRLRTMAKRDRRP